MRWKLAAAILAMALTAGALALGTGGDERPPAAQRGASTQPESERRAEAPRSQAPEPIAGLRAHLAALQRIADAHDGNRAAGTAGDRASVDYVAGRLRAAGYRVRLQPVAFDFFDERGPPLLRAGGQRRRRVRTMQFSAGGRVRAPAQAVPGGTAAGCERSDLAGLARGRVAVIRRGTCTLRTKAINAQRAGAAAVVIFNDGAPGRTDAIRGSLGSPGVRVPVLSASSAVGRALTHGDGPVELRVDAVSERRTTRNVLADPPGRARNSAVLAGGHLDSVTDGPGLNDNGSGVAALVDVAERLAARPDGAPPRVRFAFWGAEEVGLVGSRRYVRGLSPAQRERIAAYVNLDMVGSPNSARMVYEGGSERVAELLRRGLAKRGLDVDPTSLAGGSDHAPFERAGIEVGGLFTGAGSRKTAAQEQRFGGRAGRALDPCYHRACDTLDNVDVRVLGQMRDTLHDALIALGR